MAEDPEERELNRMRAVIAEIAAGNLGNRCQIKYWLLHLNRLGYRTGAGNTWIESRVRSLRKYHNVPTISEGQREWLTLADAAQELKISTQSVHKLIKLELLPARQVVECAPWVIEREHLNLLAVQAAVMAIRNGRRIPRRDRTQREFPLNCSM